MLDSAAHRAGLQQGDTVVAIDGQPIDGWEPLKDAIEERGGQEILITVERKGQTRRHRRGPRSA